MVFFRGKSHKAPLLNAELQVISDCWEKKIQYMPGMNLLVDDAIQIGQSQALNELIVVFINVYAYM